MKVLKLDSSFRPVEIISAHDAFCMVYMKRASVVEIYENEFFRSPSQEFQVPCVISLHRYVKISNYSLKCNKRNIVWRDRNTCQYCGKYFSYDELTMDHVTPKSRGGPKTWENIVASCRFCNQRKGDKLPKEAKMFPIALPKVPPFQIFHTLEKENIPAKWMPYLRAYHLA